jgi:hypothetical protein
MDIEIESETRSLEEIAEEIADRIAYSRMDTHRTCELLIEFANEIKRQAIEP